MRLLLVGLVTLLLTTASAQIKPPAPYGAVPSARQLAWHEMDLYAFIHFTTNTFNDAEWGYGDADPNIFYPSNFNANQWARIMKAAGMKGMMLTAKHHDGFCLWPSNLTDYSVRSSCWMDGKGDVVRAAAKAAKKNGLKFGVYLSPWDRHDLRYGTPEYIEYYRGQLRELLTNYGPIFEVWQDGANGGDGYYGGRCEERKVDKKTYYDWNETNFIIHNIQPNACIFSDGGPDCRWCGNESGTIGETNWCTINGAEYAPGEAKADGLRYGEEDAPDWIPGEVDVSIRPGWFWHESENSKVKSPEQLLNIYYTSVGRGANLILNIPPNKEGLIDKADVQSLKAFGNLLRKEFKNCLNKKIIKAEATNVRGQSKIYDVRRVLDMKHDTYWATDDNIHSATLTFTFRKKTNVNRLMIREHIALGQRIRRFTVETETDNGYWKEITRGTTIGNKRILRFDDIQTQRIRVNIIEAKACPLLSDINFYDAKY